MLLVFVSTLFAVRNGVLHLFPVVTELSIAMLKSDPNRISAVSWVLQFFELSRMILQCLSNLD